MRSRWFFVSLAISLPLACGLKNQEGLAAELALAEAEGSDGLGVAVKTLDGDSEVAPYATPVYWLEFRELHEYAHGKVTLFKIIFGCCFLVCLALTCAFRACSSESHPEAESKGQMAPLAPSKAAQLVKAAVIVVSWMAFSVAFVVYNKYMFAKGGFPYPVTLTAMHMGSCYVTFSGVGLLPLRWKASLMPDADKYIPLGLYVKGLVPAALLYAVCLGVGNLGFLYATVAFIQMVKPVNIVVTSIAAFLWGLEQATPTHMGIAIMVCAGVVVAAMGDMQFSVVGLICQLTASLCEGLRLIILQSIMQGSLQLDPLTTLHRFTPVAGLALCILACCIEGDVLWHELKEPHLLVLNCLMAIVLNILIAAVVSQTSAVVFVLAGVTKDVVTIAVSAALYRTPVTRQEVAGYAVSMLGICLYKVYKDNLKLFQERGVLAFFDIAFCRQRVPKLPE